MKTPASDLCCWQNPTLGNSTVGTGPCSPGVELGAGFPGAPGGWSWGKSGVQALLHELCSLQNAGGRNIQGYILLLKEAILSSERLIAYAKTKEPV